MHIYINLYLLLTHTNIYINIYYCNYIIVIKINIKIKIIGYLLPPQAVEVKK